MERWLRTTKLITVRLAGECWLVTSHAPGSHGYIQIRHRDRNDLLHRVINEATDGPLPQGMVVRHSCDTKTCANPAHLVRGTQRDNMRDMWARGRQPPPLSRYGETNPNVRLTDAQCAAIRARFTSGESRPALAREYGVSYRTIWKITTGFQGYRS